MSTVTTWLEGRTQTVPADDPRYLAMLAERDVGRHVANLLGLKLLADRIRYIENLERREGTLFARRVKAEVREKWGRRDA